MDQFFIFSVVLLWIIVLFNMILTFALIRRLNLLSKDGPNIEGVSLPRLEQGVQAPDFIAETLEGEEARLSNYLGRSVVFVFLSPSCKPCRDCIPDLKVLQTKIRSLDVEFILVITTTSSYEVKAFKDEFSINIPIILTSPDSHFMVDYKIAGTPYYCFIDNDGKVKDSDILLSQKWKALTESWETELTQVRKNKREEHIHLLSER